MRYFAARPPDVRKAFGFPTNGLMKLFFTARLSLAVKVICKTVPVRHSLTAHQAAKPRHLGLGVGVGLGTGLVPIPNSSGSGSVEVA